MKMLISFLGHYSGIQRSIPHASSRPSYFYLFLTWEREKESWDLCRCPLDHPSLRCKVYSWVELGELIFLAWWEPRGPPCLGPAPLRPSWSSTILLLCLVKSFINSSLESVMPPLPLVTFGCLCNAMHVKLQVSSFYPSWGSAISESLFML